MNHTPSPTRRAASLPDHENALSRRYLRILEQWVPVGVEYFSDWPDRPNCGHFLGGCHWYGIETIAGALAFALAASSPEYDAAAAGTPREALQEMALKGLRYLCFTHDAGPPDCVRPAQGLGRPENCGTKWGERGKGFFRESQCGTTISGMALVALLLGERVDAETWELLAAVHADYAARFGEMEPRSGVYTDTQMEENGWTSCGLASVELFLAGHPSAATWARTARRWMFATATTPQDRRDHAPFADGMTVAQLTGKTFTTLPDYMAENHGMVHPGYTAAAGHFLGYLGTIYGLFGAETPPHAFFNRQRVYDQLKRLADANGYLHPVQGMDWAYLPADPGVVKHAAAALLLGDPDGATLERRALATLEARLAGTGGRMYAREIAETCRDIQDPLIVREANISGPAYAYLLHRLYGAGPEPTPEAELARKLQGVKLYPHSGFVFHRHPKGQTSLAWRNSVMALPLNRDGIHTVAPASDSFLARVTVKGRPDSQELVSLHVDEQRDGFAAALVMDRAQGTVRQQVLFAGLPNGNSLSFERLVARQPVTVERVEQGFLRIINETFPALRGNCDGTRTLHTPDGSETLSGFVSRDPGSDVVRTYPHPRWLNLDDRLGIVFRGTGATVYHNRHHFDPWWAVADDLTLSRRETPAEVPPGGVVAELVALLAPDQPHAETAAQPLVETTTEANAAALIADGCLAAASWEEEPRVIAFHAARGDLPRVPIFDGVTTFTAERVTYRLALQPGAATLRVGLVTLTAEGELEVTASAAGSVIARNTGQGLATVTAGPAERTIRIAPGEIVALTP